MKLARVIAIAFAAALGITATSSANAGILGDAVKGVGSRVVGKVVNAGQQRNQNTGPHTQPAPQTAQAGRGKWDWVNNKDYVACLNLFYTGDYLIPANATPAERAAKKEQGRRYCNRQYGYGS